MTDALGLLHGADFAQRDVGAAAHEQFRLRWSPRSMSGESLTVAQVQTLCEAGRWALPVSTPSHGALYALPIHPSGSRCSIC